MPIIVMTLNRFLIEGDGLFTDVGGKKGKDLEQPLFHACRLGGPHDHVPTVFKPYLQQKDQHQIPEINKTEHGHR